MNKYGIEHLYIELIEECKTKEASEREIYWINKLNSYKNGYNATKGGDGKQFYDYKQISNLYKRLKSVKEVCNEIGCDPLVVRNACEEYFVEIISSSEINKKLYGKQVAMLDKNTDEIINIFNSIEDAARFLNKTHPHISRVCNGKRKTAYGYKWKFLKNIGE